jgi:hypothetical protein
MVQEYQPGEIVPQSNGCVLRPVPDAY